MTFGELEPLFGGGDGIVSTNFGNTDTARAVIEQPDGKILAAGSWAGSAPDFAVARYNPDGSLDTNFGGGTIGFGSGMTNATFGNLVFGGAEFIDDIALQSNGKILAVGYTNNIAGAPAIGGNDWAIARFNADGSLDNTFSGDGKLTINFGFDDRAMGVAIRSSGQIVVGGYLDGGGSDFGVVQINSNGTLDTTFGNVGAFGFPGASTINVGAADFVNDLALDASGRIVMAGYTSLGANTFTGPNDFALVRFNGNGTVDTTFDGDGIVRTNFGSDDRAEAVAIDWFGRIVAAGKWDGGASDFAVAAYASNGALATNFGSAQFGANSGKSHVFFGASIGSSQDFCTDVVVRRDNRIVLAGYTNAGVAGGNDFAIARLTETGALDPTLDTDGKKTIHLGDNDLAHGVAQADDGSLIAAGITGTDFGVVRFRGALDLSFSGNGVQTTNFGDIDTGQAVVVQPDGKILVGGTWLNGGRPDFAIARYNPDGTLDTSFGGGYFGPGSGMTNVAFSGGTGNLGDDILTDIALQGSGKIIAVGYTNEIDGSPALGGNDWAIARFNADGTLDTTFGGGDGKVTVNFRSAIPLNVSFDDRATCVAVGAENNIFIGGYLDGGSADWGLVKLGPNGGFDTDFGNSGTYGFPGAATVNFGGADFAGDLVLHEGEILMVGHSSIGSPPNDFAVARFRSTGVLDSNFSGDGKLTIDFGYDDRATSVLVQPNNKILVGGSSDDVGSDFAVARLQPGGALDTSFNGGGRVRLFFGFDEFAHDMVLQPDGKIVLAGYANDGGNNFAVARLNSDGSSDNTFEASGTVFWPYGTGDKLQLDLGGDDRAYGAALQPDGKILLAGTSQGNFAVARLNPRLIAASALFQFQTLPEHQVLVHFSGAYSGLTTDDFTLTNLTSGLVVPSGTIGLTNLPGNVAQLRFPGQSSSGVAGVLPDGRYRLTLPAGTITDSAGNINVSPFSFEFLFLMGDANNDGRVNLSDFNILAANFGQSPRNFAQGDFNYDTVVNLQDFNILASRFGTTVTPAGALSPGNSLIERDRRALRDDLLKELLG